MATRKKTKKKPTKSKKTPAKKLTPPKGRVRKGKGRAASKLAKKPTPKKVAAKKANKKSAVATRKPARTKTRRRDTVAFVGKGPASRSGEQAGDLQGLSNIEGADSESVDELLEEGNAFEAGVVAGVEEAGNPGVREVHTREVPEDDVPGEYLDDE
ncbi:MAG: hypothetical protein WB952_14580 [Terriglobales bacterium]